MLDDFLEEAAGKLGVGVDQAKSAAGGLLGLAKEHAESADFSELASKVPGVEALASAAPKAAGGLGDMLGGLSDALGGAGESLTGALGALSASGLSLDKLKALLPMIVSFLKEKAGGDLVKRILEKIPGLGDLLG
jgi:hypothetical protein